MLCKKYRAVATYHAGFPAGYAGGEELARIQGGTVVMSDYALVYHIEKFILWKTNIPYEPALGKLSVSVGRDLLWQYGLAEIESDGYSIY